MIDDPLGAIDYDERGTGPAIVLVPGSCATGAAFRPMIEAWGGHFRTVTTSLLGYGGTAERRSVDDPSIAHEAAAVEAVVRKAAARDEPVHLVGHSFGGLVAVAVALRQMVSLASLTVLEAPAMEALRERPEDAEHYRAFRAMNESYFAAFARGDRGAAAQMMEFYGGPGTYAAWPPRVRAYVEETTHVNILDWQTAYAFPLSASLLSALQVPTLVLWGGVSNPAAQRANARLAQAIRGSTSGSVEGAAHFMIATHAAEVARRVAEHIHRAATAPA
jgi:pimeloyl-ACP methyl ester carboxylesterase